MRKSFHERTQAEQIEIRKSQGRGYLRRWTPPALRNHAQENARRVRQMARGIKLA